MLLLCSSYIQNLQLQSTPSKPQQFSRSSPLWTRSGETPGPRRWTRSVNIGSLRAGDHPCEGITAVPRQPTSVWQGQEELSSSQRVRARHRRPFTADREATPRRLPQGLLSCLASEFTVSRCRCHHRSNVGGAAQIQRRKMTPRTVMKGSHGLRVLRPGECWNYSDDP